MKKDKDREEEFFKTILSKSELKLPFTGFEDEVMNATKDFYRYLDATKHTKLWKLVVILTT